MFASIIFLCVLCPFVGFLWARTTSLWMSKCTKRAAWRSPRWTGPRATAPLCRRSRAWRARAARGGTRRRTASPTPPPAAAAPAACRSSAPSRSGAWRGHPCPTGTPCASAHPQLRPLALLGNWWEGVVASVGRRWGWRWESNAHLKRGTGTQIFCASFASSLIQNNSLSLYPFLPSQALLTNYHALFAANSIQGPEVK